MVWVPSHPLTPLPLVLSRLRLCLLQLTDLLDRFFYSSQFLPHLPLHTSPPIPNSFEPTSPQRAQSVSSPQQLTPYLVPPAL
ncbi:Uncharacterized protein HZ326_29396 [Fusarium oxysporum f. sp. albedinis]|nr:Uncharacterized protein HZ326_29396 [Fusarium oxysporum f. sp. albedinis]